MDALGQGRNSLLSKGGEAHPEKKKGLIEEELPKKVLQIVAVAYPLLPALLRPCSR